MKRKSPKCNLPSFGKARVVNDKIELSKFDRESNDTSMHKISSLESTPENTRLKNQSASSSKSKPLNNPKPLPSAFDDIDDDISDDQYNQLLREISQNLKFDFFKKPAKKSTTLKDFNQNKYEKFTSFPYDHSLHKHISIEIIIDVASSSKKLSEDDYYKEIVKEINEDLRSKNRIGYYDYSNIHNVFLNRHSQIDNVAYEHMYQKSRVLNQKVKDDIKDINIVSAMSSVYRCFLKESKSFYFITPMHTFLFSNVHTKTSGNQEKSTKRGSIDDETDYGINLSPCILSQKGAIVVLSNTLLINKSLDSNHISYTKIEPLKPKKKNSDEEEEDDPDVVEALNRLDKDKFNNNPAMIKGFHLTLFYNMLLNDYDRQTFNIVSPLPFEGGAYKENKVKVESYYKKGNNGYVISINVYGCIFECELQNIIRLLSRNNKSTKLSKLAYTYSMRLERMTHNGEFFALNEKLTHSIEKVEYKDDGYYIK